MYRFKCFVIALLLVCCATAARAEESSTKTILKGSLYGTLSGAAVGAVLLIFAKEPSKRVEWVAYGAAGGAAVGAVYGAVSATRSLAEFEKGEVRFAIPTIVPELREGPNGSSAIVAMANLFRGTF
jgi:hypothetical protein